LQEIIDEHVPSARPKRVGGIGSIEEVLGLEAEEAT
jgi:hypothetical protein